MLSILIKAHAARVIIFTAEKQSWDYLCLLVLSETSDDLRKLHKFSVFHGYSVREHKHTHIYAAAQNAIFCLFPTSDSCTKV
jgi:hypothetical protein